MAKNKNTYNVYTPDNVIIEVKAQGWKLVPEGLLLDFYNEDSEGNKRSVALFRSWNVVIKVG